MSHNEEFDELARRKLVERQFSMPDADWQNARRLIDAQRGGRNRTVWIAGAVALMLMGGLAWYGMDTSGTEVTVAAVQHKEAPSENAEAFALNGANASTTFPVAKLDATLPVIPEEFNSSSTGDQNVNSIARHSGEQELAEETAAKTTLTRGNLLQEHGSKAAPTRLDNAVPSSVTAVRNAEPSPLKKEREIVQNAAVPMDDDVNESLLGNAHSPIHADAPPEQFAATSGTTMITVTPAPGNTQSPEGDLAGTSSPNSTEIPELLTGATSAPTSSPRLSASAANPFNEASSSSPRLSASAANPPNDATTPSTDTATSTANGNSVNDDTATVAPPAATPLLVPERAPWEISAMGGLFASTTNYAGSNSAEWNAGISKENSLGIGAELMHMGRNVGIGAGLHYSTYAERLRTDAIDRSTNTLHDFWYLNPVDTTILVITDTIPGTPPTYTGTSTNTTVNVLTQGTDTISTTQRIREARNEVNRASYLEVPILLDVHLVQGRWS
ncbi:MAG: hypothetical protein ACOH13_10370, partial [Flavobacteriales bacterium]